MCSLSNLRGVAIASVAALVVGGCTVITPLQALSSTVPVRPSQTMGTATVEGRACASSLLYLFRWGNRSLDLAKRRASESAGTVGLADVAIDLESTSYLLFSTACTVVRGRPLIAIPDPGEPGESAESPDVPPPPSPEAVAAAYDAAVSRTLEGPGLRRLLQLCQTTHAPDVRVIGFALTIDPSGAVGHVEWREGVNERFAACAAKALATSTFGPHGGASVTVEKEFDLGK